MNLKINFKACLLDAIYCDNCWSNNDEQKHMYYLHWRTNGSQSNIHKFESSQICTILRNFSEFLLPICIMTSGKVTSQDYIKLIWHRLIFLYTAQFPSN